jgi:hypothetical protein
MSYDRDSRPHSFVLDLPEVSMTRLPPWLMSWRMELGLSLHDRFR